MILLITYDLKRPGQNYTALHDEIKSAGVWWHHLESTWLIQTNLTAQNWSDRLKSHLDANDHLLVIQVVNNYRGWLPKKAWDKLSPAEQKATDTKKRAGSRSGKQVVANTAAAGTESSRTKFVTEMRVCPAVKESRVLPPM